MPIFFQQQINETTRLGIWKIEEPEAWFDGNVPVQRTVTHPHKRLQHLAGRFLLRYLFPDFPYELIQIADTRKPYLPGEEFHFSISHCGDYAAAIVSRNLRVGIDIEIPVEKITRIASKFIGERELDVFGLSLPTEDQQACTTIWSAKEAVFKWYGDGQVDFRNHILLNNVDSANGVIDCSFTKNHSDILIRYLLMEKLVLAWVAT